MHFYVLSTRRLNRIPPNGAAVELENLLIHVCNAEIIVPTAKAGARHLEFDRPLRLHGTASERVLLIVALAPSLVNAIHSIPNWRQLFGTVATYIMDPWLNWELWPEKAPKDFDCYFVPDRRAADHYRFHHGVQTHPVAFAADVLKFGWNHINRPLDLVAYGRQHGAYLQVFKQAFNDPRSNRFVYHDTTVGSQCTDLGEHRNLIWKLLHRSRCALCFDTSATPDSRQGPRAQSVIPLRYYEAIAAGTAIVGLHPTVPEMVSHFDWLDATVELPPNPADALDFLEALLDDSERLNSIHVRNHVEAWQRHDWRYRIRDLLEHLGLNLPARLTADLSILAQPPQSCRQVRWND
jgi:hypothetical protein